jgi:hypothetical protein
MINPTLPFINIENIYYAVYSFLFGDTPIVLYEKFLNLSYFITPYSIAVCFLLSVGIVYCYLRVDKIEGEMFAKLHPHGHGHGHGHDDHGHGEHDDSEVRVVDEPNKRWVRVMSHIDSQNESDWRLAILEADLILEEMLEKMGYKGETIGDKLKGIEKSDFNTLNEAWEAHKIRNQIAHDGSEFKINQSSSRTDSRGRWCG